MSRSITQYIFLGGFSHNFLLLPLVGNYNFLSFRVFSTKVLLKRENTKKVAQYVMGNKVGKFSQSLMILLKDLG